MTKIDLFTSSESFQKLIKLNDYVHSRMFCPFILPSQLANDFSFFLYFFYVFLPKNLSIHNLSLDLNISSIVLILCMTNREISK